MEDGRMVQMQASGLVRPSTRRGLFICTARLGGGAILTTLPVFRGVQHVAAQDDDAVTLSGTASEVSARPGGATARAAASEALAERGAARVQAAAALADADREDGALTQSPVAFAAADPDEGAIAQSANAVASASSDDSSASDAFSRGGSSGRRARGRKIRRGRRARRVRVRELPSTGMGMSGPRMWGSLLAAAIAASGAVALRVREEPSDATAAPVEY